MRLKLFRIAAGLLEQEFYGMVFQDSDVGEMAGSRGVVAVQEAGR